MTAPARNPGFAAAVRKSFERQGLMELLGASLARVEPGEVDIALPFSARLSQQHGYAHAGAIAAIADSANGYAALSLCPPDTEVLAVEFKINLLAPARAPEFLACGRVLRQGRTLSVCFAEVFGLAGTGREMIATMLSTIITRPVVAEPGRSAP